MKTYKELSFPYFTEVYRLIDECCVRHGVNFYLIGAQAKNINLLEAGIPPNRGTMDIDFAIMLPDFSAYNELVSDLEKAGFKKTQIPHRIIYEATNTVVDLLPFGEIEEKGTIKFTERNVELTVLGFKEVNEIVKTVEIENSSFRVSPLEGIFILKLVAWNDNPDRKTDLADLQYILKHYFEINKERFYKDHLDCLEELPEAHFELGAGARLLGRDMAVVLSRSNRLHDHILQIIKTKLKGNIEARAKPNEEFSDEREELDAKLIGQIKKGIQERI